MIKQLLLGRLGVLFLVIPVLMSTACQIQAQESLSDTLPAPSGEIPSSNQVITIGDIDPDSPRKKIERLTPLAVYLADHLQEFGITEGKVVIARDIQEMAKLLETGAVDLYIDSPFPSLRVQELVSTRIIARRWKSGDAEYWSVFVALPGSGVESVEDFVGKIVAFEKPHSTSGFVLPAGTLIQRGFTLSEVTGPEATVESDQIGYYFTKNEQNTFVALLRGQVAGAGVSNQDYADLPEEFRQQIVLIDRTRSVPRQLVSVRQELDQDMMNKITELLIGLDQTEDGRQLLAGLKMTTKFDLLPQESMDALDNFGKIIGLVSD